MWEEIRINGGAGAVAMVTLPACSEACYGVGEAVPLAMIRDLRWIEPIQASYG